MEPGSCFWPIAPLKDSGQTLDILVQFYLNSTDFPSTGCIPTLAQMEAASERPVPNGTVEASDMGEPAAAAHCQL